MKRLTFLFVCFLFWAASSSAQTYNFAELDRFLEQTASQIPSGFEVYITQGRQQLYWKTYGNWRQNQQAKIASASKWMSGALIMSLVDDGILSLDDRASRYLPYMTGDKESITVRQLMSHTSGFGGEFPLVDPCLGDSSTTLAACAEALASTPLHAPPGTAFIYSGAGMQVAGRVAEVASGKDWQTLFRERIAGPLGLTATDYEYEGPTHNPRISGGGRSTASDYMTFLTMLQQGGVYEGRRILSTRAVEAMLSNQVGPAQIVDTPAAENWRYGIGNWLEEPDSAGKTLRNSSTGVAGWTPMLDRERNLQVVIGMQNALRPFQPHYAEFERILLTLIPPAALSRRAVSNAASYEAGPVVPGELLTIFGANLGPEAGIAPAQGSAAAPTTLGGVSVLFDNAPAPLIYVSAKQVTAIVPVEVAGKASTEVSIVKNGSTVGMVAVPVADAWPALFTASGAGAGQASALNENGTVNGASNPARAASIVQLFGTGGGAADPAVPVGSVQQDAGVLRQPTRVFIGGMPADVLYAGPAPGQLSGVFQVNARVPSGLHGAVPVVVQVGPYSSLPVATVAVE